MDAFYASVEQRDFPELRGKPVAVGGSSDRGVVAAASYEARTYGVRSAMPSRIAKRRCPALVFVRARFEVYKEVSSQIMEIFRSYTDLVEPLSLDEAFLDVTENKMDNPSATLVAEEIRQKIREVTGLNASAGVSFNKFLAKIASDINKPNGMAVITPDKAESFLEELAIDKFFGIGKVTAEKMKRNGIFFGKHLKALPKERMEALFGKHGLHYYNMVRGNDNRRVNPNRIRKSIGAESTFEKNVFQEDELLERMDKLMDRFMRRVDRSKAKGRTITLKIKYHDFVINTRSRTLLHYVFERAEIDDIVKELLHTPELPEKPVRLLGVAMSNLNLNEKKEKSYQLRIPFPS